MKPFLTLISGLLFAIGAALCTGAYFVWHSYTDMTAQATRIDGIVTDLAERNSASGKSVVPVVEFKTADGSIIHVSGSTGSNKVYAKGDRVPVLYDPLRTDKVRIDDADEVWRKIWLFGGIGAPLLLIGAVMIRTRLRRRLRS